MHNKTSPLVFQIELGNMANFNYVLADPTSAQAMIVDPGDDTKTLLRRTTENNLTIKGILLTHGHFDHVGGARKLASDLDLPVYISKHEALFYTPDCPNMKKTTDREIIMLGSLAIECLHTPGHTPGCQCFLAQGNLFTGDTLFVDAVGRTDFPGGNASTLFQSLQKIKTLPDATIVWPGHNYGAVPHATLAILKKQNPFLLCAQLPDFLRITGS